MKRYYAAAGALLLGTSALAWAGDADKIAVEPVKISSEAKTLTSFEKTILTSKSDLGTTSDSKFEFASLDKDLQKLAAIETGSKLQTASMTNWSDAKLQTASKSDWSDAKVMTASADNWTDAKVQSAGMDTKVDSSTDADFASFDKTANTGMGGPLEETTATPAVVQPSNADPEHDARGIPVISDVAYVPQGFNGTSGSVGGPDGDEESYPACTSERTDNCIQLYERGVRASLADNGNTSAAVGGPYEPVHEDSAALAMNGDGQIDASKGETGATELAMSSTDTTLASHSEYQGVGGPVEAQSGYPPCSPGPGDDRCIQLYEPGVTGAGN